MLPFLWDSPDLELVRQYFWLLGKMYFILYFLLLSSSRRHNTGTEITPSQTEKCPMNIGDPMGNPGSLGNNQWAVCCPKNASTVTWYLSLPGDGLNGSGYLWMATLLPLQPVSCQGHGWAQKRRIWGAASHPCHGSRARGQVSPGGLDIIPQQEGTIV